MPTIPNPTITIFFLGPPWLPFSDPLSPSGPPSMGPALISSIGTCGCQLLDMFATIKSTATQAGITSGSSRTEIVLRKEKERN